MGITATDEFVFNFSVAEKSHISYFWKMGIIWKKKHFLESISQLLTTTFSMKLI